MLTRLINMYSVNRLEKHLLNYNLTNTNKMTTVSFQLFFYTHIFM